MYALIIIFLFLINSIACCTDWKTAIDQKRNCMSQTVYELIVSQCDAIQNNNAPKIADPAIKNIPIQECNESLINVDLMCNKRIAMLPELHNTLSPNHRSPFTSASKMRRGVFVRLEHMLENIDKLAPQFGYQPGHIHIKIFEGLRDLSTQKMLFDSKAKEIQEANPALSAQEVFEQTCKWVSPVINNVPVHSTGAAVDIRLWDSQNQEFLDMGPFGVIWGDNPIAPTFSSNLTPNQINNRLLTLIAAAQAGLVNYVYEYWHFSSGDRYASYWLEANPDARYAIYGSMNQ
jgi:D-alanyl-D-alanine dipeptidase